MTDRADVRFTGGEWKIVDQDHWIFGFGTRELNARRALDVIRKYRFEATCYVGRPFPWMAARKSAPYGLVYLLAEEKAPDGGIADEQCSELDLPSLSVSRTEDGWSIRSETETLFAFGEKDAEVERALRVLRHHAFR